MQNNIQVIQAKYDETIKKVKEYFYILKNKLYKYFNQYED